MVALAWRPDGKVLAVGFEDGGIELYDVESNVPVLVNKAKGSLTFLRWSSCGNHLKESKEDQKDWDFLIQFPSLSKAFSYNPSSQEDVQHCRKLSLESVPSILICGTDEGKVCFYMSGFMSIGFVDVSKLYNVNCSIKDVILSPKSLSTISVMASLKDDNQKIHLSLTGFPLIHSCFNEICALSEKQSILVGTLDYMADTLKQISEGWESILLEMDNKLHGYAKQMPDHHGMSADFLELLMLGTASTELETFLLQELGEKGLKKLGHSIEVSYSNMQRLVLKYLHTVSQAVNFHLAEIIGHIHASDKFESVLKFSSEAIVDAQKNASLFWAKGIELQQVIDESMKCFKAFFRWLYVEILRLSDDSVSEELSKASQQDVEFIANFLSNFSKAVDDESYTYLERVGQYMKDENLHQPVDRSKSPWHNFLKENPDLKNVPEMLFVDENASLMQAYDKLKSSVWNAFAALDCDYTESCLASGSLSISQGLENSKLASIGQMESPEQNDKTYGQILWTGPSVDSSNALFLEWDPTKKSLRGLGLKAGPYNTTNFNLVSQSFYTSDTVSVLMTSTEGHRLIQLPISPMEHYMSNLELSMIGDRIIQTGDLTYMSIFSIAGPVSNINS